jgi:hypothetical protein
MSFDPHDPNHPNADLEFDFAAPIPLPEGEVAHDSEIARDTFARKSTQQPSPYTRRETIVQRKDGAGGFRPEVIASDDVKRRNGIHAAKPQGIFKTAVDKFFRTKKASGVIAVGAESVTVVKRFKPEEFKIGLQDYIDADSDE